MASNAKKTERIPVMFEEELVGAVDDYSFRHRMRTRSATLRHLVRIGLKFEDMEKEKGEATA